MPLPSKSSSSTPHHASVPSYDNVGPSSSSSASLVDRNTSAVPSYHSAAEASSSSSSSYPYGSNASNNPPSYQYASSSTTHPAGSVPQPYYTSSNNYSSHNDASRLLGNQAPAASSYPQQSAAPKNTSVPKYVAGPRNKQKCKRKVSCCSKLFQLLMKLVLFGMLVAAFVMSIVALAKLGKLPLWGSQVTQGFTFCDNCSASSSRDALPVIGVSQSRGKLFKGFGVNKAYSRSNVQISHSSFPDVSKPSERVVLPYSSGSRNSFAHAYIKKAGSYGSHSVAVAIYQEDTLALLNTLSAPVGYCSGDVELVKAVALDPEPQNNWRNYAFIVKCVPTSEYQFVQMLENGAKSHAKYTVLTQESSEQVINLIPMGSTRAAFSFQSKSRLGTSYEPVYAGICGSSPGGYYTEPSWEGCTTNADSLDEWKCANVATLFHAPNASAAYSSYTSSSTRTVAALGVNCKNEAHIFTKKLFGSSLTSQGNIYWRTADPTGYGLTVSPRVYNLVHDNSRMMFTYVTKGGHLIARLLGDDFDILGNSVAQEVLIDTNIDADDTSAMNPTYNNAYTFYETEKTSFFVYKKEGSLVVKMVSFTEFDPQSYSSGIVVKKEPLDLSFFDGKSVEPVMVTSGDNLFFFTTEMSTWDRLTATYLRFSIDGGVSLFGLLNQNQYSYGVAEKVYLDTSLLVQKGMFIAGEEYIARSNGDIVARSADMSSIKKRQTGEYAPSTQVIGRAVSNDKLMIQLK